LELTLKKELLVLGWPAVCDTEVSDTVAELKIQDRFPQNERWQPSRKQRTATQKYSSGRRVSAKRLLIPDVWSSLTFWARVN
jgi:hypothetical protein